MRNRSALGALALVTVFLFLLAVPGWAGEVQVYSQSSNNNGGNTSQNDATQGNFATSYDNFTLTSATGINQVTWVGSYNNTQGSISGFTVDFWSNSGNAPGSLLATYSISGTANESSLGTDNLGNPLFSYSATLSSAFSAGAGTEYWLSVVPNLNLPSIWYWESSSQGDANSYQCFFGNCGNQPAELAFALYKSQQTTVPEPGSLLLLGTAFLAVAGSLRRKLLG